MDLEPDRPALNDSRPPSVRVAQVTWVSGRYLVFGVTQRGNPRGMNLWGPYMGGVPGCIFGLMAGLPPCLSGLTAEHNDGAHHGDERQAAAKGRRGRPGDIQIQDQVSGLPHAATRCGASRGSAQLFLNTEPQNTFGTSLLPNSSTLFGQTIEPSQFESYSQS